ncbi:MAG: hypothetical protein H8E12_17095 [Rhodobacteraceae bacterium]|nr:hypothetical protein [Paracoccaceae bacterium]
MLFTIKNIEQRVAELTRHGDIDSGYWVYIKDVYGEPIEIGDDITTLGNNPDGYCMTSECNIHNFEIDGTPEDYENKMVEYFNSI